MLSGAVARFPALRVPCSETSFGCILSVTEGGNCAASLEHVSPKPPAAVSKPIVCLRQPHLSGASYESARVYAIDRTGLWGVCIHQVPATLCRNAIHRGVAHVRSHHPGRTAQAQRSASYLAARRTD